MKLFAGIACVCSLLAGGEKLSRPEPFLTTGNKIVYTFYDHRSGDVNIWNHTLFIRNVSTDGKRTSVNAILALVENGRSDTKWSQGFACDSLNFYAYATNWCYVMVDEEGVRSVASGDTLVYPLNMKVGDTLPGATATEKEDWHSVISHTQMDFMHRKVEALDTLEIPGGKITAFRIISDVRVTSIHTSGKSKEVSKATEWFSPVYGIVKRKYEFASGGYTITTMEVQ